MDHGGLRLSGRVLLLSATPFVLPLLLTFALALTIGESWPRQIAPGSGLKLAGLLATAGVTALVALWVGRGLPTPMRRFVALFAMVTGLMGWPVWSVGILPSLNGAQLGPRQTVTMAVEGLETSRRSKSNVIDHWARLRPIEPDAPVAAGRYFIDEASHVRWTATRATTVKLEVASGALGAVVVTGTE